MRPAARMGCLIMTLACPKPLSLYRPRDPRVSDLWPLLDEHFDCFRQVYDEQFQAKYGFWRPLKLSTPELNSTSTAIWSAITARNRQLSNLTRF